MYGQFKQLIFGIFQVQLVLILSVGVAVLWCEAHRVTEILLEFPLLKLTDDTDQKIAVS